MDEYADRLRRRAAAYSNPIHTNADAVSTVEYLQRIQRDTASLAKITEYPQDLDDVGPAYLRSRARHYQELAAQEGNPVRARQFRDLATSFEQHAELKEKPASRSS
jgi:hypothetical protein